jgi:hypothetical protein
MYRFNSTTSKVAIAVLQITPIDEDQQEEEEDLFNDDAFNDLPKTKSHKSWTCVRNLF